MAAARLELKKNNQKLALKNSKLPLWAHNLRTENDQHADDPHDPLAELRSLSHEGRIRYHMQLCVRPGDVTGKRQRQRQQPGENEEQLLYVALYRDKIAEHQAHLEAQKSKDIAKEKSERRGRRQRGDVIDIAADMAEFSSAPGDPVAADVSGADAASAAQLHEAPTTDPPTLASSPTPGHEREGASQSVQARSDHRGAHRGADPELKKASHIASVTSAPAHGGVAAEYLEAKRLGHLFDEWKRRELEKEKEEGHSSLPSSARAPGDAGNGRHRGKEPASARLARGGAGILSPNSPSAASMASPKAKAKAAMGNARSPKEAVKKAMMQMDAEGDPGSNERGDEYADSDGSQSVRGDPRISESKLVTRLFSVVSNPKVTGEATGEGGELTRKVPNYVEGFPTLNLMRLHRGPWRLEC